MGITDKITSVLTLAAVGVAGWLIWSNFDAIRSGFCRLPGAVATGWCDDTDTGKALKCELTMNDCWKQDPYATVDTVNCKCVLPTKPTCREGIDPISGIDRCTFPGDDWCGGYPINASRDSWFATVRAGGKVSKDACTWFAMCSPADHDLLQGYGQCADTLESCFQGCQKIADYDGFLKCAQDCADTLDPAGNECAGIQRCPNGTLVDLCNPPGTTLEAACAGSGSLQNCNVKCSERCRDASLFIGASTCWGEEAVCSSFGATIPDPEVPGVWYNTSAWDRRECFSLCGC